MRMRPPCESLRFHVELVYGTGMQHSASTAALPQCGAGAPGALSSFSIGDGLGMRTRYCTLLRPLPCMYVTTQTHAFHQQQHCHHPHAHPKPATASSAAAQKAGSGTTSGAVTVSHPQAQLLDLSHAALLLLLLLLPAGPPPLQTFQPSPYRRARCCKQCSHICCVHIKTKGRLRRAYT